jgi:peptide/nickel transport system permease protein
MRRKGLILAGFWFAALVLGALAGLVFFRQASAHMDPLHALEPPSGAHWFGTDALGRDLFARMCLGGVVSLGIAAVVVIVSTGVGTLVGLAAGFFGGRTDRWLMRLADLMLCFPSFFLILAIIAILGPGLFQIFIVIALAGWMGTARMVRAEVLTLRERQFVAASRCFGARPAFILARHILPNSLAPVFINAMLGISSAILIESGLSFLGIGVQPPMPSWGNILTSGKETLGVAWWLTAFPGAAIFFTVLSANTIGEELKNAHERA